MIARFQYGVFEGPNVALYALEPPHGDTAFVVVSAVPGVCCHAWAATSDGSIPNIEREVAWSDSAISHEVVLAALGYTISHAPV